MKYNSTGSKEIRLPLGCNRAVVNGAVRLEAKDLRIPNWEPSRISHCLRVFVYFWHLEETPASRRPTGGRQCSHRANPFNPNMSAFNPSDPSNLIGKPLRPWPLGRFGCCSYKDSLDGRCKWCPYYFPMALISTPCIVGRIQSRKCTFRLRGCR